MNAQLDNLESTSQVPLHGDLEAIVNEPRTAFKVIDSLQHRYRPAPETVARRTKFSREFNMPWLKELVGLGTNCCEMTP